MEISIVFCIFCVVTDIVCSGMPPNSASLISVLQVLTKCLCYYLPLFCFMHPSRSVYFFPFLRVSQKDCAYCCHFWFFITVMNRWKNKDFSGRSTAAEAVVWGSITDRIKPMTIKVDIFPISCLRSALKETVWSLHRKLKMAKNYLAVSCPR